MSNMMKRWRRGGTSWILRTQPPGDGSRDKSPVGYLRRDHSSAWSTANPVLGDREVVYESDTDTLIVGDGKTPYTELPRYVRIELTPQNWPAAMGLSR